MGVRQTSVGDFGGNLEQNVVLHVSLYCVGHCGVYERGWGGDKKEQEGKGQQPWEEVA